MRAGPVPSPSDKSLATHFSRLLSSADSKHQYASRLSECLLVETDVLWLVCIQISIWFRRTRRSQIRGRHLLAPVPAFKCTYHIPWSIEHLYFHYQIRNLLKRVLRTLIFHDALPSPAVTSAPPFILMDRVQSSIPWMRSKNFEKLRPSLR